MRPSLSGKSALTIASVFKFLYRAAFAGAALVVLTIIVIVGSGWWTFHRLEKSIVEKMDQYYLTITTPGREEYLLQDDEIFEVPYMASKMSVSASPTRILDSRDRLLGEFITERGVYVRDPADLPTFLKQALVATEDGSFYQHRGVNYKSMARGILANLVSLHKKPGGSTITQQLAKEMFTTRKRTAGRKAFEFFCARKLERKFTKDQILLMYFNFAYFGHGCYGIESASQFYFGKPAKALQLAEAAMLIGMIASPNRYSPFQNIELSQARHRTVLRRMAKQGYIAQAAVERYSKEFWDSRDLRFHEPTVSFWRMRVNEAPYPIEQVRRELEREHPQQRIMKGGLKVRTTIDLEYQKAAEESLNRTLKEDDEDKALQGALTAVDPKDGAILAMVGGRGFSFHNQLNRAVDIGRPIGSTVKPFVYAAAFERGVFKPDDRLIDEPITYRIDNNRHWSPHNYGNKYEGDVDLRTALRKSLNSVAIQILKAVGVKPVIRELAAATGRAESHFPKNLSLALGTADLNTRDVAGAYSVFVNGGRPVRPFLIRSVEDRDGKVLDEHQPQVAAPILGAKTCAMMLEIMQGALWPGGTAHAAAVRSGFNLPAAGKTGTTNDSRDAWFSGVTPDIAASVWIGHDDMRVALGNKTGGGLAAPIWMRFIKAVYRNRPTREFDLSAIGASAAVTVSTATAAPAATN